MKRTAVTRTAHYPVTVGTGPKFLCMCTMLMDSPKYYSTHQVGNFLKITDGVSSKGLSKLSLARRSTTFTRHPRVSSSGDFFRLCFDYFDFSLILKGFIIGQATFHSYSRNISSKAFFSRKFYSI